MEEVGTERKEAVDGFLGYPILTRVTVETAEQRTKVGESLGMALHWHEGLQALCFNPRHGLLVVSGKKSLALLICFECGRMKIYLPAEDTSEVVGPLLASAGGTVTLVETSWEPAETILKAAEKKAKERP